MAEMLSIPAPFLGKVLQPLVAHGILHSQRGRSGGFRLARPANQIQLHQIVETQERLDRAKHCILGQSDCHDHDTCPLHDWWRETSEKLFSMLETMTLEDMAQYSKAHPDCRYPLPMSMPTPPAIPAPRAPLPSTSQQPSTAPIASPSIGHSATPPNSGPRLSVGG